MTHYKAYGGSLGFPNSLSVKLQSLQNAKEQKWVTQVQYEPSEIMFMTFSVKITKMLIDGSFPLACKQIHMYARI